MLFRRPTSATPRCCVSDLSTGGSSGAVAIAADVDTHAPAPAGQVFNSSSGIAWPDGEDRQRNLLSDVGLE
jgi:hypothetical protein